MKRRLVKIAQAVALSGPVVLAMAWARVAGVNPPTWVGLGQGALIGAALLATWETGRRDATRGRYRFGYACPCGTFEVSSTEQAALVLLRDAHRSTCKAVTP